MNMSNYTAETSGHCATPNDFHARMAELVGEGFSVELQSNALVAGGLPPDMCAPMYPQDLQPGKVLPLGVYSVGNIIDSFAKELGNAAPSLNNAFRSMAGVGYEAPKPQFDIVLENTAPKGPML